MPARKLRLNPEAMEDSLFRMVWGLGWGVGGEGEAAF